MLDADIAKGNLAEEIVQYVTIYMSQKSGVNHKCKKIAQMLQKNSAFDYEIRKLITSLGDRLLSVLTMNSNVLLENMILTNSLLAKSSQRDKFLFTPTRIFRGSFIVPAKYEAKHWPPDLDYDIMIPNITPKSNILEKIFSGQYADNIMISGAPFIDAGAPKLIIIYLFGPDIDATASKIIEHLFADEVISSMAISDDTFYIAVDQITFVIVRQLYKNMGEALFNQNLSTPVGIHRGKFYFTPRGLFMYIYGCELVDYMTLPKVYNNGMPQIMFVRDSLKNHKYKLHERESVELRYMVQDIFIIDIGVGTLKELLYGDLKIKHEVNFSKQTKEILKSINAGGPKEKIYKRAIPMQYCRKLHDEYYRCIEEGNIFPSDVAQNIADEISRFFENKWNADIVRPLWTPSGKLSKDACYYKNQQHFHAPKATKLISLGMPWDKMRLLLIGQKDVGSALYGVPTPIIKLIIDTYHMIYHILPTMDYLGQFLSYEENPIDSDRDVYDAPDSDSE